jgi:hypothetical protein
MKFQIRNQLALVFNLIFMWTFFLPVNPATPNKTTTEEENPVSLLNDINKFFLTLEKPSVVCTGDSFVLRVSVAAQYTDNRNESTNNKRVEVEVELDDDDGVILDKIKFLHGYETIQRKSLLFSLNGSSFKSTVLLFVLSAISTKATNAYFDVRIREGSSGTILHSLTNEKVEVVPPGIEGNLVEVSLVQLLANNRVEMKIFDKTRYPVGLEGDQIHDRSVFTSPFIFLESISSVENRFFDELDYSSTDSLKLFHIELQAFQLKLWQLRAIPPMGEILNRMGILPPNYIKDNFERQKNKVQMQIPSLMEYFNVNDEEGGSSGFFSGCSPKFSCGRELEATAAAVNCLSSAHKLTVNVNGSVVESGVKYLVSYGEMHNDNITIEQRLDIIMALISFNDAGFNYTTTELDKNNSGSQEQSTSMIIHELTEQLLIMANLTLLEGSPLLSKLTFILIQTNHSRAGEYFTKLQENSEQDRNSNGNTQNWANSSTSTAYALLCYLRQGKDTESVLPIVRWLVEKPLLSPCSSFSHEGFVVVTQALIEFEESRYNKSKLENELNMKLECEGEELIIPKKGGDWQMTKGCVTKKLDFTASSHLILKASGQGIAAVYVKSNYYTTQPQDVNEGIDFNIEA